MADSANQGVNRGHLTFSSEGNNIRGSRDFTRVIHYPNRNISGVIIGRGYDMGSRNQQEIYRDLVRSGVSSAQAQAISRAARLRGVPAAEFVRQNRDAIGEITQAQQVSLFNQIYPIYESRAKSVYEARTSNIRNRRQWSDLHPAIRDVLVDIVYQGYQARMTMPAAANNNIYEMIRFIRNDPSLSRDERGRNRAGYLEANRGRAR